MLGKSQLWSLCYLLYSSIDFHVTFSMVYNFWNFIFYSITFLTAFFSVYSLTVNAFNFKIKQDIHLTSLYCFLRATACDIHITESAKMSNGSISRIHVENSTLTPGLTDEIQGLLANLGLNIEVKEISLQKYGNSTMDKNVMRK